MRGTVCGFVCGCRCASCQSSQIVRAVIRYRSRDHHVQSNPSCAPAPKKDTHMKPAPPVMRMFLGVYSCCWLAMVAVCGARVGVGCGVEWRIGKRGVVRIKMVAFSQLTTRLSVPCVGWASLWIERSIGRSQRPAGSLDRSIDRLPLDSKTEGGRPPPVNKQNNNLQPPVIRFERGLVWIIIVVVVASSPHVVALDVGFGSACWREENGQSRAQLATGLDLPLCVSSLLSNASFTTQIDRPGCTHDAAIAFAAPRAPAAPGAHLLCRLHHRVDSRRPERQQQH